MSDFNQDSADDNKNLEEFLSDSTDEIKQDKIIKQNKPERKVVLTKFDNNSGRGETAPYSIAGKFNWGAFLFNWIWGIKYKRLILLLVPLFCIMPYGFILGLIIAFYAGTKGNQWAWEEIEYKDEMDFHSAQRVWVKSWFILAAIALVAISPVIYTYNKQKAAGDKEVVFDPMSYFSSMELTIPDEIYDQTTGEDNHCDILSSEKNIIYWVRAKNDLTEKNKNDLELLFEKNEVLKKYFVLYPDLKALQDEKTNLVDLNLSASCINSVCVDSWLYNACNNGYCIINPKTRKYYKVRGKSNVIPKALKLARKWK